MHKQDFPVKAKQYIQEKGFTLIEITTFMVIIGVIIAGTMVAIQKSATFSALPNEQIQAASLARSHLAVIRLSRIVNGYSGVSDPCQNTPSLAACQELSSFASSHNLVVNAPNPTGISSRKRITITVTGEHESFIMNYEAVDYEG